jgi:hypothetical protein
MEMTILGSHHVYLQNVRGAGSDALHLYHFENIICHLTRICFQNFYIDKLLILDKPLT